MDYSHAVWDETLIQKFLIGQELWEKNISGEGPWPQAEFSHFCAATAVRLARCLADADAQPLTFPA